MTRAPRRSGPGQRQGERALLAEEDHVVPGDLARLGLLDQPSLACVFADDRFALVGAVEIDTRSRHAEAPSRSRRRNPSRVAAPTMASRGPAVVQRVALPSAIFTFLARPHRACAGCATDSSGSTGSRWARRTGMPSLPEAALPWGRRRWPRECRREAGRKHKAAVAQVEVLERVVAQPGDHQQPQRSHQCRDDTDSQRAWTRTGKAKMRLARTPAALGTAGRRRIAFA